LYIKTRNTYARPGTAVPVPADPGVVRMDATVGAVIGSTATRVRAEDAMRHVAGYVIANDLTLPHESYYRPAVRQRCRDQFLPMSDQVPADGGFTLERAEAVVQVNGKEVHRRSFSTLVRGLPKLIEDVSAFMTLSEGDVLLVGPPDAAPLGRPGDVVRIEVPGLGVLEHSLVAESAGKEEA
jgi:5-oxopent-3-ene-1,2,5-tricarboxylate decarboxylase/2-hydroxyhepta-2,4-diene-1,7-dioate isomerase